ncbi:zf-HC2 domain-containing protein [Actinopolymorpha sp. NPDC004070]|uniref:zf-HC2 domain-containing protein n=1 Tax=Actinopolymorpha sp. NPDC004070 TaxID=3154548 RepID=UPI0033ABC318
MSERAPTCAEVRAAIGAHVLGALDAAEAAAVDAHLADCAECRAAYDDLAGLPALLGLVGAEEAATVGEALPEGPGESADSSSSAPDTDELGLRRLLARVRAERARERRRRLAVALAAAAVTVAVAGGGGWAVGQALAPSGPPVAGSTPTPSPAPTGHSTAPPVRWSGTNATLAVDGTATMNGVPWGTRVDIVLHGVQQGQVCSLTVYDRSGRRWDGGSWRVAYRDGVRWSGGIAVPANEVVRIEIKATGERPLLTIDG